MKERSTKHPISQDYADSLYFSFRLDPSRYVGESYIPSKLLLVFCEGGEAQLVVSGEQVTMTDRTMLILHPHAQVEMLSYSADYSAHCLGCMMALDDYHLGHIDPAFFAYILRTPCWTLDDDTREAARGFCATYDYVCNSVESPQKGDMIASLMSVFINIFYEKTRDRFAPVSRDHSPASRSVLSRFMRRLNENYRKDHRVTFYADLLCISPKYLTQVVKKNTSLTPKELIDRKLASESLYLLSKTSMTVQEVSIHLGFPDQSYFGRFFRRMFQMSPMQFRQNPDLNLMKKLITKGAGRKGE